MMIMLSALIDNRDIIQKAQKRLMEDWPVYLVVKSSHKLDAVQMKQQLENNVKSSRAMLNQLRAYSVNPIAADSDDETDDTDEDERPQYSSSGDLTVAVTLVSKNPYVYGSYAMLEVLFNNTMRNQLQIYEKLKNFVSQIFADASEIHLSSLFMSITNYYLQHQQDFQNTDKIKNIIQQVTSGTYKIPSTNLAFEFSGLYQKIVQKCSEINTIKIQVQADSLSRSLKNMKEYL